MLSQRGAFWLTGRGLVFCPSVLPDNTTRRSLFRKICPSPLDADEEKAIKWKREMVAYATQSA